MVQGVMEMLGVDPFQYLSIIAHMMRCTIIGLS